MKRATPFLLLLTLLLAALPTLSQVVEEPRSDVFAVGPSYNSQASPQVFGTVEWLHCLDKDRGCKTYNANALDVQPNEVDPSTVTYTITTGIVREIVKISESVRLYAGAGGGFNITGTGNTSYAILGAGGLHIKLKGRHGLLLEARVTQTEDENGGYHLFGGPRYTF